MAALMAAFGGGADAQGTAGWHDIITPHLGAQYVQTVLTSTSGLPQNSVSSITQTADGYLWLATEEGLVRYDGARTTLFDATHTRGMSDNFVNRITASRDGSLWVGSRSALLHYRNGEFESVLNAKLPINVMHEAADGTIWTGGGDGLYAVKGNQVQHYSVRAGQAGPDQANGQPGVTVSDIAEAPGGTLWLGTDKGLVSLKNGVFRFFGTADGIPAENVTAVAVAEDGSLWGATATGLWHASGDRFTAASPAGMPRSGITSLVAARGGILWIGFDHAGIGSLQGGRFSPYTARQGLPSDDVSTIFLDHDGHLWVGLSHAGVVELRDGVFRNLGKPEGLSEDMVWSVLEARDGSLWVGTNSQGLNHIGTDGSIRVYTTRNGLPQGSVFSLAEDPGGGLWIGSEHGKLSLLKNGRIALLPDLNGDGDLNCIVVDSDGSLWLGYHKKNGLIHWHDGIVQHYPVPGLVNGIVLAPDGSVWAGSDNGGVSHILRDGAVRTYTTSDGLLSDNAQSIYVDHDGVVWAGTAPGGLSRIQNDRITTYSVAQGIFDFTVGAMIEDDQGYLWMTCNRGIFKVSKKELNDFAAGRIKAVHSIVYGAVDGLRSTECNYATSSAVGRGRNGRLWFATTAGAAFVDSSRSQVAASLPRPIIEEVLFEQKAVPFAGGVAVGPGGGDLSIRFTAPDLTAPERLRFRYRLSGFDKQWVYSGDRRQAFYTHLPPGRYRFELEAAHEDENWGAAAPMSVRLRPYFWQATWFRILCLAALVGAVIALYQMRVRYFVRRNLELEEKVNKRTAELSEAVQAAEAARRELQVQAAKDGLTELWNRGAIFEMLERELARSDRSGDPVTLLLLDVDHFKNINDTHGHMAGDKVLREIAQTITAYIRNHDFAGRYGGEEFVIILPGCTLHAGVARAEELRRAIAGISVVPGSGIAALEVTSSIGVACASTTDGFELESLILRADEALYEAKRSGRNRVCPSSAELGPGHKPGESAKEKEASA